MENMKPCQECETLERDRDYAARGLTDYQPMHSAYRPKSRWLKDDKTAKDSLERAYNMAEARYQLHLDRHKEKADPRETFRNMNIIMRTGRLTP